MAGRSGAGGKAAAKRSMKPEPGAKRASAVVLQANANKTTARAARGAARRTAILNAALDEFSDRGFAATRLDDVAARAGVAKGTIYLYFRDKESLFQDLVRDMLAPMVGNIEALGQADLPVR
ncbi:MAG TPA: helix-turn-helix domain-containing protein, partial [Pseudolabrys sp.]|nr:helix-turn-helix domain-containing protein [Pseudolabrys sp.]